MYKAFNLDISEAEGFADETDVSLLDWLSDTVKDAVKISEEHNQLKDAIRDKVRAIKKCYHLGNVSMAVSEFAISTYEQKRQLEALVKLDEEMSNLQQSNLTDLRGLDIIVYQRASTECQSSYVSADGSLRILVTKDRNDIKTFLQSADTKRARACQQVAVYWRKRAKGVAPKLAEILRVKAVMGEHEWTGDVNGARDFALFAGRLIESYEIFDEHLHNKCFAYSILVHNDSSSKLVEYTDRSCVVQVRNDSNPEDIIRFQTSTSSETVEKQVHDEKMLREEEAILLDKVRDALSAKTVISLCSPREHDLVVAAGRRLLEAAPQIRTAVDLTGASICIDDCYDAWDNGFVSLPYDFKVGEIGPALIRLLSSTGIKDSKSHPSSSSHSGQFPKHRNVVPHCYDVKASGSVPLVDFSTFTLAQNRRLNCIPRYSNQSQLPRQRQSRHLPKSRSHSQITSLRERPKISLRI